MNWIGYTMKDGVYVSHRTFKSKLSAVCWYKKNKHILLGNVDSIGVMDENEWRHTARSAKRYRVTERVGKAKYVLSYHDGVKKHADGSDFFDVVTFRNKKQLNELVTALHKQGYIQE